MKRTFLTVVGMIALSIVSFSPFALGATKAATSGASPSQSRLLSCYDEMQKQFTKGSLDAGIFVSTDAAPETSDGAHPDISQLKDLSAVPGTRAGKWGLFLHAQGKWAFVELAKSQPKGSFEKKARVDVPGPAIFYPGLAKTRVELRVEYEQDAESRSYITVTNLDPMPQGNPGKYQKVVAKSLDWNRDVENALVARVNRQLDQAAKAVAAADTNTAAGKRDVLKTVLDACKEAQAKADHTGISPEVYGSLESVANRSDILGVTSIGSRMPASDGEAE